MSRKRTAIDSNEGEEVERLLHATRDPREKERLIVARMAMSGQHTLEMMAQAVGRARSCVQTWLERFEKEGAQGLIRRTSPPGGAPSLTPEVQQEAREKLREGAWRTAKEFRAWLKATHSLELSLGGCYYWMGKSGGRLKVPRPRHEKQSPGAVPDFKMQGWQEQLFSLDLPAGVPLRFWVMDESRFGLRTAVRRCWGLKGERVVKPVQQRYEWDYVYGAVDIVTGEPVFCHLPTVSHEAVRQFLGELVRLDPEAHHVVLWDGAGFHQAPERHHADCVDLDRVHVLKLPPYCPELNPVEKIWDQLRDTVCNGVLASIEALRQALLPKLREFWENPAGLSSLVGHNWLRQKVKFFCPAILPAFN